MSTLTVTCQVEPTSGKYFVSVSYGGLREAPPDMVQVDYDEVGEYLDPVEAVEMAIDLVENWSEDLGEPVYVSYAVQEGVPPELEELSNGVIVKMKNWANQIYMDMEKCARCGDLINSKDYYLIPELGSDKKYCSAPCAERDYEEYLEINEEDTQE